MKQCQEDIGEVNSNYLGCLYNLTGSAQYKIVASKTGKVSISGCR